MFTFSLIIQPLFDTASVVPYPQRAFSIAHGEQCQKATGPAQAALLPAALPPPSRLVCQVVFVPVKARSGLYAPAKSKQFIMLFMSILLKSSDL
jgi:hypothetical protein